MAEGILKLRIEGMTCDGCAQTIERYLKKDKGVEETNIDWRLGTSVIVYNPTLTSKEKILNNKVFTWHYRAEVVEGNP